MAILIVPLLPQGESHRLRVFPGRISGFSRLCGLPMRNMVAATDSMLSFSA
jgi:hypothetical protein